MGLRTPPCPTEGCLVARGPAGTRTPSEANKVDSSPERTSVLTLIRKTVMPSQETPALEAEEASPRAPLHGGMLRCTLPLPLPPLPLHAPVTASQHHPSTVAESCLGSLCALSVSEELGPEPTPGASPHCTENPGSLSQLSWPSPPEPEVLSTRPSLLPWGQLRSASLRPA
jgi:hypothetical protein